MKKLLVSTLLLAGLGMSFSGCTAYKVIGKADIDSIGTQVHYSDIKFSQEKEVVMDKNKAYVVLISDPFEKENILIEDVNGELKLVAMIRGKGKKSIIEVSEGKHVYVGSSSCGVHTITVDAKKGYAYNFINKTVKKFNLMDYCRGNAVFMRLDGIQSNAVFDNRPNYALIEENREAMDALVVNSSLVERYEEYKKNKDSVVQVYKAEFPQSSAVKIQ